MTTQWSKLTPEEQIIIKGLGGEKGVFVRPSVVRAFGGDGNAAIMLQHFMFWGQSDMANERDGWFFLTTQRITADTGLGYATQKRVRKMLVDMGILSQRREGIPAKNYYKIDYSAVILALRHEATQNNGLEHARVIESTDLGSVIQSNIVDNRVEEGVNDEVKEYTWPAAKNAKINVLGTKFPTFVDWVVNNYPSNDQGLKASTAQAARIGRKLGDVSSTATDEAKAEASAKIKVFCDGIKNLAQAVKTGYDRKYVPRFHNFAGLGPQYGKDPSYLDWANREAPKEKRELSL